MKFSHYLVVFVVAFAAILSSCKKESTIGVISSETDSTISMFPEGSPPTAKFYFDAKFNGSRILLQDSVGGYFDNAVNTKHGFCGDTTIYSRNALNSRFLRTNNPLEALTVRFYGCLNDTDTVAYQDTLILMAQNSPTFPFVDRFSDERGVEITWVDANGTVWQTQPGSGQPSTSSFFLTRIDTNLCDSLSIRIVEGQFTGTLFSNGGNSELFVTEGDFRLRLVEI